MVLYLNDQDIAEIGVDWQQTIDVIEAAARCLWEKDYAQPTKPYLRYGNPRNRIIAMPAYLGGEFQAAGIKWIASFPDNIRQGKQRASSTVLLNDAASGELVSVINAASLSAIRTASVSGLMVRNFLRCRPADAFRVGITGWGPIGKTHFQMISSLLGDKQLTVSVHDIKGAELLEAEKRQYPTVNFLDSYQDMYQEADIFMTCTVSSAPYISLPPKPGSLQLNVSLRDYTTRVFDYVKSSIVVDDWQEVCRENTDLEAMHLQMGLQESEVRTIADVVVADAMAEYPAETPIMFNPMGMAVFDVAIADYFRKQAQAQGIGRQL